MVRKADPDDKAFFCGIQGGSPISGYVRNLCPATCNCSTVCHGNESDMRFHVLLEKPFGSGNYEDVWKKCSWVSKWGPYDALDKCEKEGVSETCPLTCPPPTPGPSCQDSPLKFRYDKKKLNCDIVRNSRRELCGLGGGRRR